MNGFKNEAAIIEYINKNNFEKLNNNFKKQLIKINNSKIPKKIKAVKYAGRSKADIGVLLDDKEFLISIKKGTGNSVHQEPLESFITYLKNNFEDNITFFNDLRHFIWGDLTLDGSGKVKDRLNANEYKKQFPDKIANIQKYFNKHKVELINRFIITGVDNGSKADYLLYGTIDNCIIIGEKKIFDFIISKEKKPISIGVLTFQAWNRNINGGSLSEHKRGHIQLKWGGLKNDINSI